MHGVQIIDPLLDSLSESQDLTNSEPSEQANTVAAKSLRQADIIVVGGGPVGMRFVDEVLRRQPKASIHLFSNEPYRPYNRVQLSNLLAGQESPESLEIPFPDPEQHPNFRFSICAVSRIDRDRQCIEDALGRQHHYGKLVLATGARAHVPNIDGVDQKGVYTFRNMKDAQALYSRVASARHVVVVGGGVLGIEAAKALSRLNTRVTLVQQASRLMNRQLDDDSAQLLTEQIEQQGITILTNSGVREILGEGRVDAVRTRDGERLPCDTVLLCAGIKPNLELARESRIKVGTGIRVDDRLQTSDPLVFAIGECCEHRGQTYGLVSPGLEQAAVLAAGVCGESVAYSGSTTVSRLKVVGEDVVSFGEVEDSTERLQVSSVRYRPSRQSVYRKLNVHRGRLIGAVGVGQWPEFSRLQESYRSQRRIWFWQLWLFSIVGRLWLREESLDVSRWPSDAVVCQCQQVRCHQIQQASDGGCGSVEQLSRATGAGTVCGSCRPLLAQWLGSTVEHTQGWKLLLGLSAMALAAAAVLLMWPAAQVTDSVQTLSLFEQIWNDKDWKQVTGFSLLGAVVIGLLMSLRKRLGWRWLGQFSHWRLVHSLLGVLSAILLVWHTGFHWGENLNRWLMTSFVAILLLGSLAGVVSSLRHVLPASRATQLQRGWNQLHIIVAWPLPVLLALHVLTVYYF